jgi:uncharacterized protein (TIGR02145 family)
MQLNRIIQVIAAGVIAVTGMCVGSCSGSKEEGLKDWDGNTYHVREFDGRTWMIENLRVTNRTDGRVVRYYIPRNDSGNILPYGLLYDYTTACAVCPRGWHLPTYAEWDQLISSLGQDTSFRIHQNQKFTGRTEFPIQPAGYGNTRAFADLFGTHAIFWTSTKSDAHFAWGVVFSINPDSLRIAPQHPDYAFSVRCIKDK